MLDQYIQTLVKTAAINTEVDRRTDELTKEATAKVELEQRLKNSSVGDLAKLAGITLPENICGGCGGQMEKLGSILQCGCGMVKKALGMKPRASLPNTLPAALKRLTSTKEQVKQVAKKGRRNAAIAGAAGTAVGAGAGYAAGKKKSAAMTKCSTCGEEMKDSKCPKCPLAKEAFLQAAGAALGGVGKTIANKAQQVAGTYTKARGLSGLGTAGPQAAGGVGVMKALGQTAAAHPGVTAGAGLAAGYGASKVAALSLPGGIAGYLAQGNPQETPRSGFLRGMLGGALGGGAGGALGYLLSKGNPAATAAGTIIGDVGGGVLGGLTARPTKYEQARAKAKMLARELGLKRGPGDQAAEKTSEAKLVEVGNAAGKLLAKSAAVEMTPEEIQEAAAGAQGREDVAGRASSWGRRGAALGGLGGGALGAGAGYGLSKLLGRSLPMGAALGGAAGAGLGGVLGHRIGSDEGAEEALADRLVSYLRSRRAAQIGAQHGYLQGLTQGGVSAQGPQ